VFLEVVKTLEASFVLLGRGRKLLVSGLAKHDGIFLSHRIVNLKSPLIDFGMGRFLRAFFF
jgi:hypothetical protein